MSLAWATILFIVIMLPGVAVLMGIAASERFAREVVRSTALGEIALAAFAAITVHSICLLFLMLIAESPLDTIRPLIEYELVPGATFDWHTSKSVIKKLVFYDVLSAIVGFLLGLLISRLIHDGHLRFLATHKWIYDVVKHSKDKEGLVTAYIMTTTVEDGRALMYKGRLAEIYLKEDGTISYVAMKNCRRFYMKFDDLTTTGKQLKLFEFEKEGIPLDEWNYLMIAGDQIANVLFNKSNEVVGRDADIQALDAALAEEKAKAASIDSFGDGLDHVVRHEQTD